MPNKKELQQQIDALVAMLAANGIVMPLPRIQDVTDRADYIEHGSPEHATFLGLIIVPEDQMEQAEEHSFILWAGANGTVYRLEDEISGFEDHHDPAKIARMVLRQKVAVLETGKPEVPGHAPHLFNPESTGGVTWEKSSVQV